MEIWGIDVSHYQGAVDWSAVRGSGASYAFAKATEGTTLSDPMFSSNWSGIKQAGLLRGAYHFGHPGFDAETQAVHFHAVVSDLTSGDLPPVLDIETCDGHPAAAVVPWVLTFVAKTEALFGRALMIYTGGFWRNTLGDPEVPELASRPLWLASYTSSPQLPRTWSRWSFWQYTNGQIGNPGPVPGVQGACDRSRFAGDLSALQALTKPSAGAEAAVPSAPQAPPSAASSWPGHYLVCPSATPLPSEQVRSFQSRMGALGFTLAVDGVYGPACKAACSAFQRERGLNVDGIVGPATWSALFAS